MSNTPLLQPLPKSTDWILSASSSNTVCLYLAAAAKIAAVFLQIHPCRLVCREPVRKRCCSSGGCGSSAANSR